MSSRVLENAIVRLLRERPFYGQFILNLRREESTGSHAIGTTIRDGVPTLAVNEPLFTTFEAAEQEALLEHSVKHILHLHMARCKGRNRYCWDIACDCAINPFIEGLPQGAPRPVDYGEPDGLSAEEYYSHLVPKFDIGSLAGMGAGTAAKDTGGCTGQGDGDHPMQSSGTIDDHTSWQDADSTPYRLAEEVVRGIVREATRKSDGQVPADVRQLVDNLLKPSTIPWREVLRQFVATAGRVGRRSTWLREHRRFAHDTPGTRKRHRLNLLIGIDVSDSTDSIQLREAFAQELMLIARGCDARLTVLYANSRIQRVKNFTTGTMQVESYHGGGFTDLRPVFDYAHAMHPLPAAVIYLTDGVGPAPERMDFPTLWVLTSDGEKPVPWGVELRLTV